MVDKNRRVSSGVSSEADSNANSNFESTDLRPFWQRAADEAAAKEDSEEEAPGGWAGEPEEEQGPQTRPAPSGAATISSLPAVSLPAVVPFSAVFLTYVPVDPNAPAPSASEETAQSCDSVSLAPSVWDENQNPVSNWGTGSDQVSVNDFSERISLGSASNASFYEPLRTQLQQQLDAAQATQLPRWTAAAAQPLSLQQLFNQHPQLERGGFETTSTRSQQFRAPPHLNHQQSNYSVQSSPAAASRFERLAPPEGQPQPMRFASLQSIAARGAATPTLGSLRASLGHLNMDPAHLATGVSLVRVPLSSTYSSTSSSLNLAGAGPVAGHFPAPIQNHATNGHSPVPQMRGTPVANIAETRDPALNNLNLPSEGVAYMPIFPYYMQNDQFKNASIFSPGTSYFTHERRRVFIQYCT